MTERTISMKAKFVPLVLVGDKDVTRRLKKEGETKVLKNIKAHSAELVKDKLSFNCTADIEKVLRTNGKPKFKAGEVYQVVVDKQPVWYCPECKNWIISLPESFKKFKHPDKALQCEMCCYHGIIKPLLIKVLSIKEEKLLDITEDDAKKEGFFTKSTKYYPPCASNFLKEFYLINGKDYDKALKENKVKEWNPDVWRIEFEVVK